MSKGVAAGIFISTSLLLMAFCVAAESDHRDIESVSGLRQDATERILREIVDKHAINTAGMALIKNGRVEWRAVYGWQSPGVPATADTLFNVGSITKTVTAETVLRLVADGKLSLDEPMSRYWVDPDLEGDPFLERLTARMALTHTTGFMNWRHESEDFRLRFESEPGTEFGYSGEGFKYLASYAEKKLNTPFEKLVETYVFQPAGVQGASLSVQGENFPRIARPLDDNGEFPGYYCYPGGYCREAGSYSAAGDMVITVTDYARILISAMAGESLNDQLLDQRNSVQVVSYEIDCSASPDALCPTRLGYGLGWNVTELADDTLIGHSGTDWSLVSLAYYYLDSKDGLIVIFNAPNRAGIAAMVDTLELLDPDSPKLHEYRARRARATEPSE